jgi:hypothetical protein
MKTEETQGWMLREDNKGRIHVLPANDMREHQPTIHCWCRPDVTEVGSIVHASMDEREKFETGERKPS